MYTGWELKVDIGQALLEKIMEVQRSVGSFQLTKFRQLDSSDIQEKQRKELVTQIDIESEKIIKSQLSSLFPEASFLGEESGRSGDSEYLWVVDPIDGTTNFVSGLDQFCISIGLMANNNPILGAIYKPTHKEFFTAIEGNGAFHNGRRLNSKRTVKITESLIATGFPYRSLDLRKSFYKCADEVLDSTRGIRRMGSAALDLANLACGFFQGFWETDLQSYDVAAGLVLLKETGCHFSNFQGEPYNPFVDRSFVAGEPDTFKFLQALTEKYYTVK